METISKPNTKEMFTTALRPSTVYYAAINSQGFEDYLMIQEYRSLLNIIIIPQLEIHIIGKGWG